MKGRRWSQVEAHLDAVTSLFDSFLLIKGILTDARLRALSKI